jgi:hypothetical protein
MPDASLPSLHLQEVVSLAVHVCTAPLLLAPPLVVPPLLLEGLEEHAAAKPIIKAIELSHGWRQTTETMDAL